VAQRVRDVMTPTVQSVDLRTTVQEAATLMRDSDVGSLPVIGDEGAPVGVVTDRDIVVRGVASGKDPASTRIVEVFTSDLVSVEPEESLDEALRLMAAHRVRRLPVVENGQLVGVVAQADVALSEGAKKTGHLVEEVSQPSSTPRE
jgi:CBS domain-containing protein